MLIFRSDRFYRSKNMYREKSTATPLTFYRSLGLSSALALIYLISSSFTRMTPLQFTVSKEPIGCLRSDFF